jgi:hypothetical protein
MDDTFQSFIDEHEGVRIFRKNLSAQMPYVLGAYALDGAGWSSEWRECFSGRPLVALNDNDASEDKNTMTIITIFSYIQYLCM